MKFPQQIIFRPGDLAPDIYASEVLQAMEDRLLGGCISVALKAGILHFGMG